MESFKIVHKSFIKFAIAIAVSQEKTLLEAKKIISKGFDNHPQKNKLNAIIQQTSLENETWNQLKDQCLTICEDFGPDREYVTLIFFLEKSFKVEIFDEIKSNAISMIIQNFRNEIERINATIPAPPLYNVFLESRSLLEWTTMFGLYHLIPRYQSNLGKPVLLMPPYLGNDYATTFVRKYLTSAGFKTYKWDLGINMINSKSLPKLIEKLDEIFEKHQQKVSLVGWSGGGIFAKIIANRHPEKIAQLITIGSPIWGIKHMQTPVIRSLEFLRGKKLRERNEKLIKELEQIPQMPITCIYTKTDGLVPWKHCLEAATFRSDIKNIEVFGSHTGLGANATVLLTVAKTLHENIANVHQKGIIFKAEKLFYPDFWNQKGIKKFKSFFI